MAFVYEVNGQRVEFEKEPTEKDIDEAAASLGTKKPETARPKPVEGAGGAAFGVYPQALKRPESQQDREASKEMGLQTVRGVASNIPAIAGIPGSIVNTVANAPRTAQAFQNRVQSVQSQLAGNERVPEPQLPEYNQVTPYDMSYFANLTPGPQPSSPQGQLAFSAGQLAGAPIVGPVAGAIKPIAQGAYDIAKGVTNVGLSPIEHAKSAIESFGRGYGKPAGTAENTALMPIGEKYYTNEDIAKMRAGEIHPSEMTSYPTTNLTQNTLGNRFAYNLAPENSAGQKLVAPAGKSWEGYFENLGSTYKQNPYLGALDIASGVGGAILTGGVPTPISAIAKAGPAWASRKLSQATNFDPANIAAEVQQGLKTPKQASMAVAASKIMPETQPQPTVTAPVNPATQPIPEPTGISPELQQRMDAAGVKSPAPQTQQPVTGPAVPDNVPIVKEPTMLERLAALRKAENEGLPAKEKTIGQLEREQQQMLKQSQLDEGKDVINRLINGEKSGENLIQQYSEQGKLWGLDKTDLPNNLKGYVKQLEKAGVSELPLIEGMTEGQIIQLAFKELVGNRGKTAGPKNVSRMIIDEPPTGKSELDQSIIAKRSFNENLEKYRYGSPKDPLTLDEFNHLQNSDFIKNQGFFDRLKNIDPDYTEHSFWFKDKNGVTTNLESHNGALGITKIDKNNPNNEIVYSKLNPNKKDTWIFTKSQNENGSRKILEKFEVKDTYAPRHPKLKDWPEEFTNSKYDME